MAIATEEPVSLLNPVSEEAENRKKEAQKHWKVICKAGGLVSVNSLTIGYHAYALKRDNLFGILGFEDEKQAQKDSGVGESTWYANIRLAEQFSGVAEELFVAMKQANAKALADLPESKRLTEYWLRAASTDPIETFKEKVDIEMNGKARASDGKEASVSLKMSMPVSRRKSIETGIRDYAKSVGEQDEGRALELLVAEHTGGVSLIGAITAAVTKIADLKKLGDSGVSADEALQKTYAGLDEIVELFRASLESVQNLESE